MSLPTRLPLSLVHPRTADVTSNALPPSFQDVSVCEPWASSWHLACRAASHPHSKIPNSTAASSGLRPWLQDFQGFKFAAFAGIRMPRMERSFRSLSGMEQVEDHGLCWSLRRPAHVTHVGSAAPRHTRASRDPSVRAKGKRKKKCHGPYGFSLPGAFLILQTYRCLVSTRSRSVPRTAAAKCLRAVLPVPGIFRLPRNSRTLWPEGLDQQLSEMQEPVAFPQQQGAQLLKQLVLRVQTLVLETVGFDILHTRFFALLRRKGSCLMPMDAGQL